jgi:hypothetical protein
MVQSHRAGHADPHLCLWAILGEEVITGADRFSELNLTSRYAPVKTIVNAIDQRPAERQN